MADKKKIDYLLTHVPIRDYTLKTPRQNSPVVQTPHRKNPTYNYPH